ncbi:MAG: 2-phospho-L-lactate guanylyltransferase [Rubrobacteraceae bacterium]
MSLFAVVPVKDLSSAKSRLSPALDPVERVDLTLHMLDHVLAALREAGVENVCVVSPDRAVLDVARERGASPLYQESRGLNPALEEARRWAVRQGASTLLVLPADLPFLTATDVLALLEEGPQVTISPDKSRTGTNALLLRPPDALPFAFGPDSFETHLRLARERGLDVSVRELPNLALDLDTAEDLECVESLGVRKW